MFSHICIIYYFCPWYRGAGRDPCAGAVRHAAGDGCAGDGLPGAGATPAAPDPEVPRPCQGTRGETCSFV